LVIKAIWKSCEFFFFLLKQGRLVIRNISGNGPTFFLFSFYQEVWMNIGCVQRLENSSKSIYIYIYIYIYIFQVHSYFKLLKIRKTPSQLFFFIKIRISPRVAELCSQLLPHAPTWFLARMFKMLYYICYIKINIWFLAPLDSLPAWFWDYICYIKINGTYDYNINI